MEDFINVFYGEKIIVVPGDINFKNLRLKILQKDKRLIKYFSFKSEIINENLSVKNFPTFELIMDRNIFQEYKAGQYRCLKCRKYLKLSKLTCHHSNICRTYYYFKKCQSNNEIIKGGYYEKNDEQDIFLDEDENADDISEQIEKILEKHEKNYKKKMMDKINEILFKQNKENSTEKYDE